jgi:V/A-type H+/Na+-transporting ATPase subunit E
MTLESLVEEIRRKGEAELRTIDERRAAETARIVADRDQKVEEIRSQSARATEVEVQRERAQRVAAAKLRSRKLLYEAREARLESAIAETQELLRGFTSSAAYPNVLRRMCAVANDALGKPVRVSGRTEDAGLLSKVAGKSFDPTPQPILGGLIAETLDGTRRLNLSFNELLRLREDKVRELLA